MIAISIFLNFYTLLWTRNCILQHWRESCFVCVSRQNRPERIFEAYVSRWWCFGYFKDTLRIRNMWDMRHDSVLQWRNVFKMNLDRIDFQCLYCLDYEAQSMMIDLLWVKRSKQSGNVLWMSRLTVRVSVRAYLFLTLSYLFNTRSQVRKTETKIRCGKSWNVSKV